MHPTPYQHELNPEGIACAQDCPACLWVWEQENHSEGLVSRLIAAKMILMDLDELLLTQRDAIGPAVLEFVWIHRKLREVPTGTPGTLPINRAASELRKSKRTISRNFRRLEEAGLIKREARLGRSHLYWVPSCHQ